MAGESPVERDVRLADERARSEAMLEASKRGFVRGGAYGLAGGLAASLLTQRMSASYRALRLPIKASFVSSIHKVYYLFVVAMFGAAAFASEHAIYRRRKYPAQSGMAVPEDRGILHFIVDHRLAVVGSTVGLAVAGAMYRMANKQHTSGAQKFMNVRLYGQMAGLVAIIGLMGLTAARKAVPGEKRK